MKEWDKAREEIIQVVLEIRQYLCDTEFAPEPFTKPVDIEKLKGFADKLMAKFLVKAEDQSLPDSIYSSLIFPTTIEEAGKFLTDKGLTDREKTAVSGTIARLGWEVCATQLTEKENFVRVVDKEVMGE